MVVITFYVCILTVCVCVSGIKQNTLSTTVSRSCRFMADILLTSTQKVAFYSGHTV